MANISQSVAKISGYLEKKAKLRIGSPWKKYWFVLEGRLLLYYRSKDEYETLSPCKGSINLCPPCNIKPALSAACVFQIECRASTVTLRAESRAEQQRWMQALLAAIAQSKSSPNRMSHFRYSLDDLPVSSAENKKGAKPLSRQNTMPYRVSSSPKREQKQIIERLQLLGAQTYGGSLDTIAKFVKGKCKSPAPNRRCHSSFQDVGSDKDISEQSSEKQPHANTERVPSLLIENDQYSIIREENSIDLRNAEQESKASESEGMHSLIVENDQYAGKDLEVQSDNLRRKRSFVLENDQYCATKEEEPYSLRAEHLYERISSSSNASEHKNAAKQSNLYDRISSGSDRQTLSDYSVVHRKSKTDKNGSDHEYSVPVIDHNKNNVVFDNDQYMPTVDDTTNDEVYSNGLIDPAEYVEYSAIDKTKELEDMYEDPDQLKKKKERNSSLYQEVEIEPLLPPRPDGKKNESSEETSSQTSSNGGKKVKKNKFKILTQLVKSDKKSSGANGAQKKVKPKQRSSSFLKRVWGKKNKSLEPDSEITYETVDYESIERQIRKDKNDIQMLQELQKILEARKNILQEKLQYNERALGKQLVDSKTVQSISEEKEEPVERRSAEALNEERPSLPPRQSSQSSSANHLSSSNIDTITIADHPNARGSPPARSATSPEADHAPSSQKPPDVKTIDQIIADLTKEKDLLESRQKVRELIEKFNEFQTDDGVVLRKKARPEPRGPHADAAAPDILDKRAARESDELTRLLEELSKVTCAPVLPPGVTSSLVTPTLTNEEWLQLMPIRRRRLSDPDYDVPRPHSSLQLRGRAKNVADNPIPATRFFGPVLSQCSMNHNMITTDLSSLSSMDPDSLEFEQLPPADSSATAERDCTAAPCPNGDQVIYAQPKLISGAKAPSIYSNLPSPHASDDVYIIKPAGVGNKLPPSKPKAEEMFVGSLEPLAEISTAF